MDESKRSKPRTPRTPAVWSKHFGSWAFALAGTAGVAWLLMVLAGVFSPKVIQTDQASQRPLPPGALLVPVRSVTQTRYETAVGTIEPIHESSVASKILAKVEAVNVTAGQLVRAGDVLVSLNDEDLQSQLSQAASVRDAAEAIVQQAERDLTRAEQLFASQAVSAAELESARTAVKTTLAERERASQAVEEAKVRLAYSQITAPFDGIVVDKAVQAGDTVIPGQMLLSIYDPDQMQLVANVRESLAMQLKIGQQLPAKLETLDHECMATVREVVPQADVGSRSFQVKVSGPCPPGIYSGMFARLMLPLEDETVLLIPAKAARRVGQLTLVDVAEGAELVRRQVQLGRSFGQDVEVLSGLREGEQVVLNSPAPEAQH